MRWPQELHFLHSLHQVYMREFLLRISMAVVAAVLIANVLFNLVAAVWPLDFLWRFVVSVLCALAMVALYSFRRPKLLTLSRRMDRELQSAERIQTYVELREKMGAAPESDIVNNLYQELTQYFKAHPPTPRIQWRSLRKMIIACGLVLLLFVVSILVSPMIRGNVSAGAELKQSKEDALESLEELAQLLEYPLLDALQEELALLQEQLESSTDLLEMELILREAEELLEQHQAELAEMISALDPLENALNEHTSAETASMLAEDPLFRAEFLAQAEKLMSTLPPGEALDALRDAVRSVEEAEGTPNVDAVDTIRDVLANMDPDSARQALQEGAESLRRQGAEGAGSEATSGGGGTQNGADDSNDASSGGGDGGNSGDGGSGSDSGSGSGSGDGGGAGEGAGTGSGGAAEQDFFFIPGEQEFSLSGEGEEGNYTLQELLRFNPDMVTDDYAEYYRRYSRQGTSSLQGGQYPTPLEGYLLDYFEAIAP